MRLFLLIGLVVVPACAPRSQSLGEALTLAAGRGEIARVNDLLVRGARLDFVDEDSGDTPLHWASSLGREAMVRHLLSRGADPTIRNLAGRTPADVARTERIGNLLRRRIKSEDRGKRPPEPELR